MAARVPYVLVFESDDEESGYVPDPYDPEWYDFKAEMREEISGIERAEFEMGEEEARLSILHEEYYELLADDNALLDELDAAVAENDLEKFENSIAIFREMAVAQEINENGFFSDDSA